jgi:hypothetical protein
LIFPSVRPLSTLGSDDSVREIYLGKVADAS